MTPKGIQLRRTGGWRLPENAKSVARPSKWGNPFRVGDLLPLPWGYRGSVAITPEIAVALHTAACEQDTGIGLSELVRVSIHELRGYDLACWCPLYAPCHRNTLLRLANP